MDLKWEESETYTSLKNMPGYIILVRKPEDVTVYGTVENSWSLGIEPNRAFLYWDNEYQTGHQWATKDLISFSTTHPEWAFTIYDARDEEKLPIYINWDLWLDAHRPSGQTISGVKNKHDARNLRFTIKGQPLDNRKESLPLKMSITSISF